MAIASPRLGVRATTLDRFTAHKYSLLFTRKENEDITSRANRIDKHIYEALEFSYGKFPRVFIVEDILLQLFASLTAGSGLRPEDIDLIVTSNSHYAFNAGRSRRLLPTLFPNAEIKFDFEHHMIHQWQTYLPSGFDEAAILAVDESGEGLERLGGRKIAMSFGRARGDDLEILAEHLNPESSPGLAYATFSRHVGYSAGEEGKLMGLAPYGTDTLYRKLRRRLCLRENGSFELMPERQLRGELNRYIAKRKRDETITPRHADVAYAGQRLLEDILDNAVQMLQRNAPGIKNLCLAGGVALNSSANEKIFKRSRFEKIYIPPNPGDDGQALACALYGQRIMRKTGFKTALPTDYLGRPYSDEWIDKAARAAKVDIVRISGDEVARALADGAIVALYQGGAEFGPRALGNRSILARPWPGDMTVTVNERVKRRELYRPYAPVVLEEKAHEWFDFNGQSPFMLRVVTVRPEKQRQVAAITHIDGSARVQTLDRQTNPRLYAILQAFERLTGVPILMNTSFNLAGKPIVETPENAIESFLTTDIDILLFGDRGIIKPQLRAREPGLKAVAEPTLEQLKSRFTYERLKRHSAYSSFPQRVTASLNMGKLALKISRRSLGLFGGARSENGVGAAKTDVQSNPGSA